MAKIINLSEYKKVKDLTDHNRQPLYISYKDGKVSTSPHLNSSDDDFGTRIARIRASLEKINDTINELKKLERK